MSVETPNLSEMGIRNPSQIVHYSLVRIADDMDVLKINYGRPRGSFLPKRRSYEFKRMGKPMPGAEATNANSVRMEISPLLSGAIAELDHLLADGKAIVATKQELQDEIAVISKELNARLAHLSEAIDALE
ncbi:uncharacterized protein DUF3461 [Litoreibacter meonggei]|uniref:Uncharacterized protein DUF3461 n=1 Tax=Litoreibacter meonggei TaxID=1049199 RepID=A0A497X539_9RHOB|nr:DUF3461 family protein [Litoreibacter meonggei]RLJ60376.1 uncharacterized protein DUF3461 [Litoreibacter meonggei]